MPCLLWFQNTLSKPPGMDAAYHFPACLWRRSSYSSCSANWAIIGKASDRYMPHRGGVCVWMRMPFKLPIKPFDSNCWCCHRQFAKLIDHLLFKLKFDVLEQAIQHRELMGWDEIQGARETCAHRGNGLWSKRKKKKRRVICWIGSTGQLAINIMVIKESSVDIEDRGFCCVIKGM